jgi:hypothetical protein
MPLEGKAMLNQKLLSAVPKHMLGSYYFGKMSISALPATRKRASLLQLGPMRGLLMSTFLDR